MTPTPPSDAVATLVPVSKLRTAIVALFPDTDIGVTRMREMDRLITAALTTARTEAVEACCKVICNLCAELHLFPLNDAGTHHPIDGGEWPHIDMPCKAATLRTLRGTVGT